MNVSERTVASGPGTAAVRPRVSGKFIFVGKDEFYVRGFTYGTFRPDADGNHYPEPEAGERDFARMAANGLNAVRAYTVPPRWLLDAARRHGPLLCGGAALDHAWVASAILGAVAATLALRMLWEFSVATAVVLKVLDDLDNAVAPSAVGQQGAREA